MVISIHDVPGYERHLLFCTRLSAPPRQRRRRRRRRASSRAPVPTIRIAQPAETGSIVAAAGYGAAGDLDVA